MFDEKIVHPNVDQLLSYLSELSDDDIKMVKSFLLRLERNRKEEAAKKAIPHFEDITSGSILYVTPYFINQKIHCVVLNASKFREGVRVWYLNDKVEDIPFMRIADHMAGEPYVPLQLRPDSGKRDRLPLPRAREDLRARYQDEYNELVKNG